MKQIAFALCLLGCILATPPVMADEFRPALLEIHETEKGWFSVTWKVPLKNGRPLSISPILPVQLEAMGPASTRISQGAAIEESNWSGASGSLVGGIIEIEGLTSTPIDVILRLELADGSEHSTILRSSSPSYVVPDRATKRMVAGAYWKIGTVHILEGIDHLLFVLALTLLVPNLAMLLKTITAFTVAHSVSLALATLGVVNMPGAPTEAVIALSILFLAVEIVHSREGRTTLTARHPWVVAMLFGLVHGLGFAGALANVGLPQQEITLALFSFNVGVETGQLLFVCAVRLIAAMIERVPISWPQGSWKLVPYSLGGVAAFWTMLRVNSFL